VLAAYSSFKVKSETHLGEELILFWGVWWVLLSLIERNRAPFDLLEGERELIRGFNLEIGSLIFVFLFLREYGIIIVISLITSFIVWDNIIISPFVAALIVFIRRCYPRVRYDSFIGFMWQDILPAGICILFIFIFLK
jgi:NADH:ubiquinone oxidoreductase subunit H